MKTSSFEIARKFSLPNTVAISIMVPTDFDGAVLKVLRPPEIAFRKYLSSGDTEKFTKAYTDQVLSKLDPRQVFDAIGEDAILLCFEAPGQFCHRRLVARWFEDKLGISVPEYDPKVIQNASKVAKIADGWR